MKKLMMFMMIFVLTMTSFGDFLGKYYNGKNFETYVGSRVDSTIAFTWENYPGVKDVESDNFSVKWTGRIVAPKRREYEFQTYTDDGVRLYVTSPDYDNYLDIDNWIDSAPFYSDGTQNYQLESGESLSLTMEYYENGGGAVSKLEYRSRKVKNNGSTKSWSNWALLPSSLTSLANESAIGNFENIINKRVVGWAYDPDSTKAIFVKVYVNGKEKTEVKTSINRDDINGGGDYGFDIDLSSYLLEVGTYSISIKAIDSKNGEEYEIENSPKNYIVDDQQADPVQSIIFSLSETGMNLGSGTIEKTDEGAVITKILDSNFSNLLSTINDDGTNSFLEPEYGTGIKNMYVLKQDLPLAHNDVGRAKLTRSNVDGDPDKIVEYNFIYPVGFDSIEDPQNIGDRITINWVENNINKYRVYFKNQKIIFRLSKQGVMKTADHYTGNDVQINSAEKEISGETNLKKMLDGTKEYVDLVFDYYTPTSIIINDVLFSYSSGEVSLIGLPIDQYRVQIYSIREAINGAYSAYTMEAEKLVESNVPQLDEYEITANKGVYLIDHIKKDNFADLEVYFSTKTPFNAEINKDNVFYNSLNQLNEKHENGENKNVEIGYSKLETAELREFKYPLDIVFAIDNSGSMQEEIDSVKDGLEDFADALEKKGFDVKMNIITFGPTQNKYYDYWSGRGYPVGDWVDKSNGALGKVEKYYDKNYLAVYKHDTWFSDVATVKDAFKNMKALYGYNYGQENGAWAMHHAVDLLKRNGRSMKRDGTIVDPTVDSGAEVGSLSSQKWIMLLTDENMDNDNLSGMNAGYTSSNVVSELSKGIAENGIILTGIFHIYSGNIDDMGNTGENPADTGDIYYNDFKLGLGESFHMYEMGKTGQYVKAALLDSVGNVGIIKRWKIVYPSPFNDKDGTYRFVNFDLDNVLNEENLEIEIVNKNDEESKKYKAPSESGAVLNMNFVNPNYKAVIEAFENGGNPDDFDDMLRYRDIYGDYGKVLSASTDINYKEMSKADDTIIVYERDKDSDGNYQALWTISSRNSTSLDLGETADENQDGVEPLGTGELISNPEKEYLMAMYPDRKNTDNQIIARNFDGFGQPLIYNKMELKAIEGKTSNVYRLKLKNPSRLLLDNIEKGDISYSVHEVGAGTVSRVGDKKFIFDINKFVKITADGLTESEYIYKEDIDVSALSGDTGEIRIYINYSKKVMEASPIKMDILLGLVIVEKDFEIDENKKPNVEFIEGVSYVTDGTNNYLKIEAGKIRAEAKAMDENYHMDMARISMINFDSVNGNKEVNLSYGYDLELDITIGNQLHVVMIDLDEKLDTWQNFNSSFATLEYSESRKYLLMAMARNNAGVTSYKYKLLKLDKTAPSIDFVDLHEEVYTSKYFKVDGSGENIKGTVTVLDSGSGVNKIIVQIIDPGTGLVVGEKEFDVDEIIKLKQTIDIEGPSIVGLEAGKKYNLKIIVEDLAGSQTVKEIKDLMKDSSDPVINDTYLYTEIDGKKYINLSNDGDELKSIVKALDVESGLDKIIIQVKNKAGLVLLEGRAKADSNIKTEQTVEIESLIAGKLDPSVAYDITVKAVDAAGREKTITEEDLYFDNKNPSYVDSKIYEKFTIEETERKYLLVDDTGLNFNMEVSAKDEESGLDSVKIEIFESDGDTVSSSDKSVMTLEKKFSNTNSQEDVKFEDEILTGDNAIDFDKDYIVRITIKDKSGRETEELVTHVRRQAKLTVTTVITNPVSTGENANEFKTEELGTGENKKKYVYFEGNTKATGVGAEVYPLYTMKYTVYKSGTTNEISSNQFDFTSEGFSSESGSWYSKTTGGVIIMWKNTGGSDYLGREFKVKIPVENLETSQVEKFDLQIDVESTFDRDAKEEFSADKSYTRKDIYYDPIKPLFYSFEVENTSVRDMMTSLKNDGKTLESIDGEAGNIWDLDTTTKLKYDQIEGATDADYNLSGEDSLSGENYIKRGSTIKITMKLRDSSFLDSTGEKFDEVKAYADFSSISNEVDASKKAANTIEATETTNEIEIIWDGIKVSKEDNGIASIIANIEDKFGNKYSGDFEIGYSDNTAPIASLGNLDAENFNTNYQVNLESDEKVGTKLDGKTGIRAFIVRYTYDYTQSDWPRTKASAVQSKVNHHKDKITNKEVWISAVKAEKVEAGGYKGVLNKIVDTSDNNNDGEYRILQVYALDFAGNISGNIESLAKVEIDEKNIALADQKTYDVDTIAPNILVENYKIKAVLEKTEDANGIEIISNDYVKKGDRARLKYWVVDRNVSSDPNDYILDKIYPLIARLTDKTLAIEIGETKEEQGDNKELTYVEIIVTEKSKDGFEITSDDVGKNPKSLPVYAGKDTVGNIQTQEENHVVTLDNEVPGIGSITNMQFVPNEYLSNSWSIDANDGIRWDVSNKATEDGKVTWAYTRENTANIAWQISDSEDLYTYTINGVINKNASGDVAKGSYNSISLDGSNYLSIPVSIGLGHNLFEILFYDEAGNRIGKGSSNSKMTVEIVNDQKVGNSPSLLSADKLSLTGKGTVDVDGYFELKIPLATVAEQAGIYKYKINVKDKATGTMISSVSISENGGAYFANEIEKELGELSSLGHSKTLVTDSALKDRNIRLKIPDLYDGKKVTLELTLWDQLGNHIENTADYLIIIPSETMKIISTEEGKDKKIETEMKTNSADVFEVEERVETGITDGDALPESLQD